ncbi:MAG: methyltransferase domain-containing protein [Solirubrobacteraceae bacterium]
MAKSRYDQIGVGYVSTRREDPRIAKRIHAALGEAGTVVNVGAGAGSYEPRNRRVIAVEPSAVMAAQRPPELPRAILAEAYPLPLADQSVDAAMALLTVHHWDAQQEQGVRELRRVARGPVVVARVAEAVRRDLHDGTWDERHGHMRNLAEYDAGLRLVIHTAS